MIPPDLSRQSEDTFEWPPRHRAYFEELLPSVTKILIIGWQAKEAHFTEMLREKLPMRGQTVAHILVVGKDADDGKAILHRFAGELGQRRRSARPAPNHSPNSAHLRIWLANSLFFALSFFVQEKCQNLPACSEFAEEPE